MKKRSQLSEELKRHLEIVNYTDSIGNQLNEALKVTFQEQEPEEDENVDIVDTEEEPTSPQPEPTPGAAKPPTPPTPPTPGATPPTPAGATPPKPGATPPTPPTATPPKPGATPTPPTPPPPPAEVEDEVEEVDVTDLVNNQEEVGDSVNKFASQLSDIESKFSELSDRLGKMDMIFQKIDAMEDEIQKMAPVTPVEKLELRSLDSFPYNQRLDNYFEDKKAEYKKLRGIDLEPQSKEKEYTLTAGEAEEWDDNEIGNSFNPNYNNLNEAVSEGKLVQAWGGSPQGGCVCVYAMEDGSYDHVTNHNPCECTMTGNCCSSSNAPVGGELVGVQPSKGKGDFMNMADMDFTNSNTLKGKNLKGMARKGMRVKPRMMR